MQTPERTVVSQYAAAPTIRTLIAAANQWIDPGVMIGAFYQLIWNVATARGYGLDVWGRIVGVNRVLRLPISGKFLGFNEATTLSADPFDQSPFYNGAGLTQNYALSDDGFRTLIYAKALANICDGSIPGINAVLLALFPGRGNAWCSDDGGMAMTFHFSFALTAVEAAIVTQSGVLPKSAGVALTISQGS